MSGRQAVVQRYQVSTTKVLKGGKRLSTRIGVAQEFENGDIHVNLNALPLSTESGASLWLSPVDDDDNRGNRSSGGGESYDDPKDDE